MLRSGPRNSRRASRPRKLNRRTKEPKAVLSSLRYVREQRVGSITKSATSPLSMKSKRTSSKRDNKRSRMACE